MYIKFCQCSKDNKEDQCQRWFFFALEANSKIEVYYLKNSTPVKASRKKEPNWRVLPHTHTHLNADTGNKFLIGTNNSLLVMEKYTTPSILKNYVYLGCFQQIKMTHFLVKLPRKSLIIASRKFEQEKTSRGNGEAGELGKNNFLSNSINRLKYFNWRTKNFKWRENLTWILNAFPTAESMGLHTPRTPCGLSAGAVSRDTFNLTSDMSIRLKIWYSIISQIRMSENKEGRFTN